MTNEQKRIGDENLKTPLTPQQIARQIIEAIEYYTPMIREPKLDKFGQGWVAGHGFAFGQIRDAESKITDLIAAAIEQDRKQWAGSADTGVGN